MLYLCICVRTCVRVCVHWLTSLTADIAHYNLNDFLTGAHFHTQSRFLDVCVCACSWGCWGLWSVQKRDLPPIAFFDSRPPPPTTSPPGLCVSASLSSNPCTPYVIHPPLGLNSCAFNDIQYKFIILIDRLWIKPPDGVDEPCVMDNPHFAQLYNEPHHIDVWFSFPLYLNICVHTQKSGWIDRWHGCLIF